MVLRRQVPPRFDAPARSWFGGLPRLPEGVAWPRSVSSERPTRGERPLHFLAQICCADLPAALWGGLGPREGWLALFVDPNHGTMDEPDALCVLHLPELGAERPAPDDLGPVHDGEYSGPSHEHLLPGEAVHRTWLRWPVDLLPMPNAPFDPPDAQSVAATLYAGAPVAAGRLEGPWAEYPPPHSVRGVRVALTELRREILRIPVRALPPLDAVRDALGAPGAVAGLRSWYADRLREAEAEAAQAAPGTPEHAQAVRRSGGLARLIARLTPMDTLDALLASLEASAAEERTRLDGVLADLDAIERELAGLDPARIVPRAEWDALCERLAAWRFSGWTLFRREWGNAGDPPFALLEVEREAVPRPPRCMPFLAAADYVDPMRAAMIPAATVAALEPHWRGVLNGRPHRMGGRHEGVQSDPVDGPSQQVLLFQIASDNAMNWMWGDVGAIYVWIGVADLRAGRFDRAFAILECH